METSIVFDQPEKKRSKFLSKKTVVDGIKFDSIHESKKYLELKIRERAGEISNLELQKTYRLVVNDFLVCKYIADFVYQENGVTVVADAKGFPTPDYIIKRKLMKAVHGIEILEIGKQNVTKKPKRLKSLGDIPIVVSDALKSGHIGFVDLKRLQQLRPDEINELIKMKQPKYVIKDD